MRALYLICKYLQIFLIFIRWPVCQGAEGPCLKFAKRRRLNTAYIDDERNYSKQCKNCYHITVAHYQELWDDYRSGQ